MLHRDAHDVEVDGEAVELTAKEFDLLAYLLENPGIVHSRERLLDRVWGLAVSRAARAPSTCTSRSFGASSAGRS